MALTIDDLRPKDFKINIKGVEVDCKPPRLSHTLVLSKVGEIFKNIQTASKEDIVKAEQDFDWVVSELIPELGDIKLDIHSVIDVITQLMSQIEPDENIELQEKGVKFDSDPKAEKIG